MKFISSSILLFALFFVNGASVTALPAGTEEQSIAPRQNVGSVITVGNRNYRLIEQLTNEIGASTFRAQEDITNGGPFFAKRPTTSGTAPPAFSTEVANTQSASTVLGTNIFVSSGTSLNFFWMITSPAPGGEIQFRWISDRTRFATRTACDADMVAARTVIVSQNQRLANDARTGFVHGDNHPGNWFVPTTGNIQTAVPIDFGIVVRPPPPAANIVTLVQTQYAYNADTWQALREVYGICR
ncbi:hypothetical protein P691DRAFT_800504 [Macrolepiota fuliginosa MF-IS2]|uniref:ABC1 atypical kinase-like domain-containing protein n=1 Tax=Macrolepiota fuliginosa MF-IS2 TaxID=1400762 RepID=A0A9P5WZ82_9AGAR|nr:hypothetical protein P691DRAFT_800504 [Macrolepiota fuliginosa MF-IS2]